MDVSDVERVGVRQPYEQVMDQVSVPEHFVFMNKRLK